jgi:hypothetical protein
MPARGALGRVLRARAGRRAARGAVGRRDGGRRAAGLLRHPRPARGGRADAAGAGAAARRGRPRARARQHRGAGAGRAAAGADDPRPDLARASRDARGAARSRPVDPRAPCGAAGRGDRDAVAGDRGGRGALVGRARRADPRRPVRAGRGAHRRDRGGGAARAARARRRPARAVPGAAPAAQERRPARGRDRGAGRDGRGPGLRLDLGGRARTARPLPRLGRRARHGGAVQRGDPARVPLARRGLRAARARGDAPRAAGRVLRHDLAARGRRRRRPHPLDEAAIRDAVARLLGDAELRGELARRGREQAARFSWQAAAEGTWRAYEAAS